MSVFHASFESLATHVVPDWYRDAKLGVMVSWGLYSIPGWAPLPSAEPPAVIDARALIARVPYAEWYLNSMSIEGSPTQRYHLDTFGSRPYDRFADDFRGAVANWDPAAWIDCFADAGARYIVPLSKHHDGFLLWPSGTHNPNKAGYQVSRDVIGELATTARASGLEFGVYYSGGADWSFWGLPFERIDPRSWLPPTDEYAAYVDAHWRELIERYEPAVLWNDIGYPDAAEPYALFADYYNGNAAGIVNDRFADYFMDVLRGEQAVKSTTRHYDVQTPEYKVLDRATDHVWETCRGVGLSFGYNRQETEEHTLSAADLIWLLVDVVSKNGNLLLGVGPTDTGEVSEVQRASLAGLGEWLRQNGEAIYGTRPWSRHATTTGDGREVRFTSKEDVLYAVMQPGTGPTLIQGLHLDPGSRVEVLGAGTASWRSGEAGVVIDRPLPAEPASVVKITGGALTRFGSRT